MIEKFDCVLSNRAIRAYIQVQIRLNAISPSQSQQSSQAKQDIIYGFKKTETNYATKIAACVLGSLLKAKEKRGRSSIAFRFKEKENYGLIYEKERRKFQCRLPKPEPNAEYQCRALLLPMGAGEAGGGRRGQWGP